MAEYRVYTIDSDGHITRSTPLICEEDSEAMEKARQISNDHTLEIWSGKRFVARLYPDG